MKGLPFDDAGVLLEKKPMRFKELSDGAVGSYVSVVVPDGLGQLEFITWRDLDYSRGIEVLEKHVTNLSCPDQRMLRTSKT